MEFNSEGCGYYTELDAVELVGKSPSGTYVYLLYWQNAYIVPIKTHDSESRGQEEAGHTRRMSVLFTGSTGVKFVNALNKPPLKLSLS